MTDADPPARFEALVLPHLDAAYNLARWLTRNDSDAEDVVQDACLRAIRYLGGFRGDQPRPWLLQIVRNTCWSWLRENRPAEVVAIDDIEESLRDGPAPSADEPLATALRKADRLRINQALGALPIPFREVLVLRELEDLSYRDIARIADIPVGTVMSRLARARALMRLALAPSARPLLRTVPRVVQGAVK
ncbi:MAG TPA: sigma-70 family RNA polymerase sigma factor [Caldimonas sp.]